MSKQQIKDMLKDTEYEPFRYIPALAQLIGDRPSIFLYHIHYWLEIFRVAGDKFDSDFGKFEDNRWWLSMSLSDWEKEFCWSRSAVKLSKTKLLKTGIILCHEEIDRDAPGGSRTWYSIDYDKLNEIIADGNAPQEGSE